MENSKGSVVVTNYSSVYDDASAYGQYQRESGYNQNQYSKDSYVVYPRDPYGRYDYNKGRYEKSEYNDKMYNSGKSCKPDNRYPQCRYEICISKSLAEALSCGYYMVTSGEVLEGPYAWVGLFNPQNSGVNIYVDNITISSFACGTIIGECYYNASVTSDATRSIVADSSNLNCCNKSQGQVKYLDKLSSDFGSANVVFETLVPVENTITVEKGGTIIIPPGKNIVILLSSPDNCCKPSSRVGFSWWEERIPCGC